MSKPVSHHNKTTLFSVCLIAVIKQHCSCRTSVLPAFFVFGKASIKVSSCVKHLLDHTSKSDKPVMVCEPSLCL